MDAFTRRAFSATAVRRAARGADQCFFMGGGKALINAYFRSAERLGVKVRYNTQVTDIELDGGRFVAAHLGEHEVDGQLSPPNALKPGPACWRPVASSPTVTDCAKPGVRTNAVNGHRITS